MGDVRFLGQVPEKCPTCGDEHLKQVQPNFAEKMLANVLKKASYLNAVMALFETDWTK
jgi:hypothetical protein